MLQGLQGAAQIVRVLKKTPEDVITDQETETVAVRQAQNEAQLLASHGQGYLRLAVTDHVRPTDQDVDNFLEELQRQGQQAEGQAEVDGCEQPARGIHRVFENTFHGGFGTRQVTGKSAASIASHL